MAHCLRCTQVLIGDFTHLLATVYSKGNATSSEKITSLRLSTAMAMGQAVNAYCRLPCYCFTTASTKASVQIVLYVRTSWYVVTSLHNAFMLQIWFK